MAEPRAEVRNAADPAQVKRAARKDRNAAAQRVVRATRVLESYDGRAFCWDLLRAARVYESIWRPSAEIHYLAGRQDFGHELVALLLTAGDELYLQMEREGRERARIDARTTDAGHTPSAEDSGGAAAAGA